MEITEEEMSSIRSKETMAWAKTTDITEVMRDCFIAGKQAQAAKPKMVVISRKWEESAIEIQYLEDGIYIAMPIDKFIDSILAELPHPSRIFTRERLRKAVKSAQNKVQENMKDMTVYYPPPMR